MTKFIYFAALVGAAIFLAYIAGAHTGRVRCDAKIANANSQRVILDTKNIGKINETVIHTGTGDIRRILHEKYTIVE